jgi:hypothetical protein
MINYDKLIEYTNTDRQHDVICAMIETGTSKKAGELLSCSRQAVEQHIKAVQRHAAARGYAPEHDLTRPVPKGFIAETSTRYDEEGNVVGQWVKSKADKAQLAEMHLAFIEGLSQSIKPAKPTKKPKALDTDLASAIVFGDAHLGLLAHAIETLDEDYDLAKTTADIRAAIDYCVDCAPPSEEGWFINVGDFLHAASTKNQTDAGTPVDTSARHNQVMVAAGQVIRYSIDKMLTKFGKITVINARGNHDNDAAFALNMYLQGVYEKEPRVTVQGNDSKFNFIEFGANLIGVNHGDKINAEKLCGVMTRRMAEAWGRTTFRRWWLGHIHHKTVLEHLSGVTLESFPSLTAVDNWHAGAGYGAERRVTMITLHKKHGEVNRMAPSLDMLRNLAA